jgi:hypothetical protein
MKVLKNTHFDSVKTTSLHGSIMIDENHHINRLGTALVGPSFTQENILLMFLTTSPKGM